MCWRLNRRNPNDAGPFAEYDTPPPKTHGYGPALGLLILIASAVATILLVGWLIGTAIG